MSAEYTHEEIGPLLERAAAGDETAWRSIIDAYTPRVFGLIRAQCGRADLAEEITQSTFCTVVSKIGGYTESGRFEAWLFRIAMNRLRDEMRRRKRHAVSVEDDTLVGLAGGQEPERQQDHEGLNAMRAALARLPEADREVLQLRHHAQMSFKQVAEVLGKPLGTVLARHHRALQKVRDLMSAEVSE